MIDNIGATVNIESVSKVNVINNNKHIKAKFNFE